MIKFSKHFQQYILNTKGVIAVIFGILVPVIVSSVGISVDMAQAYLVKARLGNSLDAAALAGASSGSDNEAAIQDIVDAFMDANYPENRIGTVRTVDADLNGDELTVTATARLDTSFMKIFGFDYIDVDAVTIVQREVRGLEVVMVLDNTGSMTSNNNIQTLRTATRNFIEILFESVSDPEYVRVGLVPYASSVNVGPYGLGFDADDNAYGDDFVIPPENDVYASYYNGMNPYTVNDYGIDEDDLEYDPSQKGQWHGCVEADDYPLDVEDHDGPWTMYRHDYNGRNDYKFNTYYNGTLGDGYNALRGPNVSCPDQPIVPLTSDEAFLNSAAQNMGAAGNTLGNIGMAWGWRVISPQEPFSEGSDYDDEEWDKVVLIMTDGINTMSNIYSAYGRSNEHNIDAGDLNDRLAEICTAMKEEEILVYAVTFDSGVNESTKDLYRNCASSPANYKDAPGQDELVDVFEQIARELSNLFIRQ